MPKAGAPGKLGSRERLKQRVTSTSAPNAPQLKLRAFIADELRAWEKTFPDELWMDFGRLTGWQGKLHSRPKWWGRLVIELIYDLDPDVAEYIKTHKPPAGVHWHRHPTDNVGVPQLVSRLLRGCRHGEDLP